MILNNNRDGKKSNHDLIWSGFWKGVLWFHLVFQWFAGKIAIGHGATIGFPQARNGPRGGCRLHLCGLASFASSFVVWHVSFRLWRVWGVSLASMVIWFDLTRPLIGRWFDLIWFCPSLNNNHFAIHLGRVFFLSVEFCQYSWFFMIITSQWRLVDFIQRKWPAGGIWSIILIFDKNDFAMDFSIFCHWKWPPGGFRSIIN